MQTFFYNFPRTFYNNMLLVDTMTRINSNNFKWLSDYTIYYDYEYQDFDTEFEEPTQPTFDEE